MLGQQKVSSPLAGMVRDRHIGGCYEVISSQVYLDAEKRRPRMRGWFMTAIPVVARSTLFAGMPGRRKVSSPLAGMVRDHHIGG